MGIDENKTLGSSNKLKELENGRKETKIILWISTPTVVWENGLRGSEWELEKLVEKLEGQYRRARGSYSSSNLL